MEAAYKELAPRGFKVAAVSIDADGPEPVKAFAAEFGLTFDLLQDQSGLIQREYQTTGVPESSSSTATGGSSSGSSAPTTGIRRSIAS